MSTEETIKKYLEEKGWKYVGIIKGNKKIKRKVRCICPNNHTIDKVVGALVKKPGCIECILVTTEKCHKLASEKGFKFLSEKYVDFRTKYTWECSNKHKWNATYDSINHGSGCNKCLKVPFNDYIKLIESKGGKVISEEKDYINTNSKIKYICKDNHICECRGSHLLDGIYCAECSTSSSERTCRKIFEYLFKVPFPKNRDFMYPLKNNYIELDGCNMDLKIAFEYNGEQHYKRQTIWQTEEKFKEQQERDKFVLELCEEKGINLIVIPYTISHNNLYSYIVEQFPEHNFEKNIDYCELKLESYGSEILNELKILVKEKYNGKILSESYINCHEPLECECEKGHKFQKEAKVIKRGITNFCNKCGGNNVLHNISEFCKKYNYTLLSIYTESRGDMEWKCNKCECIFIRNWNYLSQLRNLHTC